MKKFIPLGIFLVLFTFYAVLLNFFDIAKYRLYKLTYLNCQAKEWQNKLCELKELEDFSVKQNKIHLYKFSSPAYNKIIKQKTNHISLISRLMKSYKIKKPANMRIIIQTDFPQNACMFDKNLEEELLIRNLWLIQNSKNIGDTELLKKIQTETIDHYSWITSICS